MRRTITVTTTAPTTQRTTPTTLPSTIRLLRPITSRIPTSRSTRGARSPASPTRTTAASRNPRRASACCTRAQTPTGISPTTQKRRRRAGRWTRRTWTGARTSRRAVTERARLQLRTLCHVAPGWKPRLRRAANVASQRRSQLFRLGRPASSWAAGGGVSCAGPGPVLAALEGAGRTALYHCVFLV
jgi:hypothetical protein